MDESDRLAKDISAACRPRAKRTGRFRKALSLLTSGRWDLLLYKLGRTAGLTLSLPYLPTRLMIEPTNACNLGCPLCLAGSGKMNRATRMMTLPEFRGIIDQVRGYVTSVLLWNAGEPFLNNELLGMVAYACSAGIHVSTSTNSQYFKDREFCADLDTIVYQLSRSALSRINENEPEIAAALNGLLARMLSERLVVTNQLLEAMLR